MRRRVGRKERRRKIEGQSRKARGKRRRGSEERKVMRRKG
jgi:hypothetical protein